MQGYLESIKSDDQTIKISGWAVEPCQKQPAQSIAIFCGDRLLGYGASGVQRPKVAEGLGAASAEHAGFLFRFERHQMPVASGQIRAFVLSGDGLAAELRQPSSK
jgi:hypothetical protein